MLAGAALVPATAAAANVTTVDRTAGETPFIVPAGVNSVKVMLVGASGGAGNNEFSSFDAPGGAGGVVHATIAVQPGEVLFAEVGLAGFAGNGLGPGHGGANGGGTGGENAPAGGGGGATDIRTCSIHAGYPLDPVACSGAPTLLSRLVVAGGGGGGGSASAASSYFGGGGGPAGGSGGSGGSGSAPAGGTGGGPGTVTAGGQAGTNSDSTPAHRGAPGVGGRGADESGDLWGGGGGGGGGLYGGGGGGGGECVPQSTSVCGGGGGGGGGSSGVPVGVTGVTGVSSTVSSGTVPEAAFGWSLPVPTALTAPASNVNATAASLNGVVDPNGSPITACRFTVTPAPPKPAQEACVPMPQTGNTPVLVSAALTGLSPSTTYSVHLTATSAQGTATGKLQTFKTLP